MIFDVILNIVFVVEIAVIGGVIADFAQIYSEVVAGERVYRYWYAKDKRTS